MRKFVSRWDARAPSARVIASFVWQVRQLRLSHASKVCVQLVALPSAVRYAFGGLLDVLHTFSWMSWRIDLQFV